MEAVVRPHCPLCGESDCTMVQKGSFHPGELSSRSFRVTDNRYGHTWNFYRCHRCGFVFSNPTLKQRDISRFYTELTDKEYSLEARGREKNFRTILRRLDRLDPPGNRLLDIGAASGIFLNLARQKGYRIAGIEPSADFVREARGKYGIDLFQGTLEEFPDSTRFSVITLLDILEHMVNPREFLHRVVPLLQKNGIVVIVTPDVHSLAARILKKRWWHYRMAHVNFFNLESLRYLMNQVGLHLLEKKRYAWNFSLYYLLTRLLPLTDRPDSTLQKLLKNINLKIQLFDSWEIYARKL